MPVFLFQIPSPLIAEFEYLCGQVLVQLEHESSGIVALFSWDGHRPFLISVSLIPSIGGSIASALASKTYR